MSDKLTISDEIESTEMSAGELSAVIGGTRVNFLAGTVPPPTLLDNVLNVTADLVAAAVDYFFPVK
ncbi:MAG: hypothetical protein K2X93_06415 [Candidatus Obscuribacterales bacterium]|nr:hypothetical protein [Candidatus Obscuribacterales bacterium]